jgi:hypothetical protein
MAVGVEQERRYGPCMRLKAWNCEDEPFSGLRRQKVEVREIICQMVSEN